MEEPAVPGDMPFEQWAERRISRPTGIEDRTPEDLRRDLRIHLSLLRHTTLAGVPAPAGPACPAGYALQPPGVRMLRCAAVMGTDVPEYIAVVGSAGSRPAEVSVSLPKRMPRR